MGSSLTHRREAILENAAVGLRDERGCRRFDVCLSEDDARCFLYELHTDRSAFDGHLRAAHFLELSERSAPMVREKRVETLQLVTSRG